MARVVNENKTVTLYPASFEEGYYRSIENEDNPINSSQTNTTYTRFYLNNGVGGQGHCFYKFDTGTIPKDATIDSISCSAKASCSSTNNITDRSVQLYHTTQNPKGTSTSFGTNANSISLSCGTWTGEEIQDCYIKISGTRGNSNTTTSAYINFYGATLSITYSINGTYYLITSELDTDLVDSITPLGETEIFVPASGGSGKNYELIIFTQEIDGVIVKDNDTDVTSRIIEHNTVMSGTATRYPKTVIVDGGVLYQANASTLYLETINKGVENASTSTYNIYHPSAQEENTKIDYYFDFSDIPTNALINSVSVRVRGHYERVNGYDTIAKLSLFSGNTQKGSSSNFTSTSAQTITMNAGTWNRSELNNAYLRFEIGVAGGLVTGVTWSVSWSLQNANSAYYTYTLTDISSDHEIEVIDNYSGPKYTVNTTVRTTLAGADPLSKKVRSGRSFTLNIYSSDLSHITLSDNSINNTSLIQGTNGIYYYIISSIDSNHTILINETPWYEISVESMYENVTISTDKIKVYEGDSFTITLTFGASGVASLNAIKVLDNDTVIPNTSFTRVNSSVYTLSVNNVIEDHEIVVLQANTNQVTSVSTTSKITLDPAGVTNLVQGESLTIKAYTELSSDLIIVKDNDVDTSSSLVYVNSSTETVTNTENISSRINGYENYNSNYNFSNIGSISNAYSDTTSTDYARLTLKNENNSRESRIYLDFNKSNINNIPSNATIISVICNIKYRVNSTQYVNTITMRLCSSSDSNLKGTALTEKITTADIRPINGGSDWTLNELNNIRLYINARHNNQNNSGYLDIYGAELEIEYTYSSTVTLSAHYEYTLTNVNTNHLVNFYEVFVPEVEEPDKVYYLLSISSINATTDPVNGTIRVEEGTNQIITITPTDEKITLITDNGVDISNLLNANYGTYTITEKVSGASYGFELDNNTNYYTSTNAGQGNSAAVARINFNFTIPCLVTIEYINYAEATYDYGIFGNINTALGTTYTSDSNAYRILSSRDDNVSTPQALTYEIDSGTHFVDVKYRKDTSTNSNNDNLQFRIASIQPLEEVEYTYTLTNITEEHSLVFIFGEVIYYNIQSSADNIRISPTGNFVTLPNGNYSLTIIPNKANDSIEIYDNGRDVSRAITVINSETSVYYVYTIKKVTSDHIITVLGISSNSVYIKIGGSWVSASKIYKKVGNSWVEQDELENVFQAHKIYINKGSL